MTEPIFDPAELFAQCKVRYNNKGIVDYMQLKPFFFEYFLE